MALASVEKWLEPKLPIKRQPLANPTILESSDNTVKARRLKLPKYIVRYGLMRSIGVMTSRNDEQYRRGNEVVVRSDRGVEVGQVLCEATDDALSHLDQPPTGSIVRMVSNEDANNINSIDGQRFSKIEICKREISKLNLES